MDRVCIGHSADTTDLAYLESLLNAGVYLSMDRYPGGNGRPEWRARNATLKSLIDRGWADRLMLGHDYAPGLLTGREPAPPADQPTRYLFVSNVAIPALREAGVSQDTIDMMMIEVPATGPLHRPGQDSAFPVPSSQYGNNPGAVSVR